MFDIQNLIQWLRKNISRRDVLVLLGLVLLYAATRLIRLDSFPIFSDEGIYINWARVAWRDASLRFISLTDGRQPLQTWATIPFLKLFPDNYLFAGRLFSVASGFFALSGIIVTAWYLFNKKAAYIAGFLYIITPYFLFYDRIALADSVINGFTLWMFFLSIVLAKTRRLDSALILGFVSGFAVLSKSSVRLYVAFMSLAVVFVLYNHKEAYIKNLLRSLKAKLVGKESKLPEVVSFFMLYGVVVAIAYLIYNVQRLSPYLHYVAQKNTTFILTPAELLADPLAYFSGNIINIPYYIFTEMGYIVPVLGILGLYFMYKKDRPTALYLISWLVLGYILISLVARVLFPRYVLSLGGLLLIPSAYLLSRIRDTKNLFGILAVILVISSVYGYTIIFRPAALPFPAIDRGQYLEDWPAGWGVRDIVDNARDLSQTKPVYIVAEGDFGMSGDVLRTHIGTDDDKIHVKAYWPLDDSALAENQQLLADNYVLVMYSHCKEPGYKDSIPDFNACNTFETTKPLRLIEKYEKTGGTAAIYLFELLPE